MKLCPVPSGSSAVATRPPHTITNLTTGCLLHKWPVFHAGTLLFAAKVSFEPTRMTLTETRDVASGKVNGDVQSKRVWGCLLTNIGYLRGVLTLYYSLIRSGTKYPFYVIYTEVTIILESH